LAAEESGIVRINIASLVATLAQVAIVYWPELLNFIDQLNRNENLQAREIALYLLSELLEDPSIDEFLAPHMQQLMQLFSTSLTD